MASSFRRRRPAWTNIEVLVRQANPTHPVILPSILALISISTRLLPHHSYCSCIFLSFAITAHYQCNSTQTNPDRLFCSQSQIPQPPPRNNINHRCRTPFRLDPPPNHTPQPWPLHAPQTAAIHSPRCLTVTTPYPPAPRATQTIQFPQTLPSHTKSANSRRAYSPNMQSPIRLARAPRASVAQPTKTVPRMRLRLP